VINKEYAELANKNGKLHKLLALLDDYSYLNFGLRITITEIYRTQEEFDKLYAQTPPEKRPARSPHQDWNAADIRSSIYTEEQINKMLTFLNTFTYKTGVKKVAIYHAIAGNVGHLHVQYV